MGGALVAALMVVMLVAALSAAVISMSSSATRRHIGAMDQKRAFYIAEAGLSEACLSLVLGKSGHVGSAEQPAEFGNGLFWVTAADAGGGLIRLESTALCGTGRAALAIYVTNEAEPVGAFGFFGEEELSIGADVEVDGFDADEAVPAVVGSNGDVIIDGSSGAGGTFIDGDVQPGPGYSVLIGAGSTVTGSTLPTAEARELPPIDVPSLAPAGNLTALPLAPTVVSGESSYGVVLVRTNSTLVVAGPSTLVVSSLTLKSGGTLEFDTSSGPVTLYLTRQLSAESNSILASPGPTAADVTIHVAAVDGLDLDGDENVDPAVTLLAGGVFHGFVYAPDAAITLPASLTIHGGVVARSLAVSAGATLHYDAALAAAEFGPMVPAILSWQALELPEEIKVRWNAGPRLVLGIDEAEILPKPAEAHDTNLWGIVYIDLEGVTRKWVGDPSEFDWGDVGSVVYAGASSDPDWAQRLADVYSQRRGRR